MLPSISALHSATRARTSNSPASRNSMLCDVTSHTRRVHVRCNATLGATHDTPEVPTDAIAQYILQQLAEAYPRALTALELAKSIGTYEIRSRVNSVLYRELTQAGLVEQDPAATGSKPAWRLTAPAVAGFALNPASSTTATGTTASAVSHHQTCESRSTASAATYFSNITTATTVAGQPLGRGASYTSAEPTSATPSGAILRGGSSSIRMAPVSCAAAAEPSSSNHSTDSWSFVDCLTAAFDHLWNAFAAPATTRMQGPGTSQVDQLSMTPQTSDRHTLQQNSIEFEQRFQDAFERRVRPASEELQAAKDSIHDIAHRLQQSASSQHTLKLDNQSVTIDRVCIAGSVGKGTSVSGSFDVDIVLFVNLSPEYLHRVSLMDPDSTHNSAWMQSLYAQLYRYLATLPQMVEVKRGPSAVSCQLVVGGADRQYPPMYVNADLLLAPNLAGAVADDCKAAAQRAAALQPLLAIGDAWSETAYTRSSAGNSANTSAHRDQSPIMPKTSYARAIWLQETTTQYVSAAAAALEALSGNSANSKVVTNTMTLTKAWIREGLQQGVAEYKYLKGFMIELLVLKAAHTWCQLLQQQHQVSLSRSNCGEATASTGRHMLDLFLLVLEEAQHWADIAENSKCVSRTDGILRPILYTAVPCKGVNGQQISYYTDQQAWGLQKAVCQGQDWTRGEQCFAQPIVVHPVDPLDNVFSQRRFGLPMWHKFKAEAATLYQELCQKSWGSSLAAVLGPVSGV